MFLSVFGFKTIFNNAQRSCSAQNWNWCRSGTLSNTRCRDSVPKSHFVIATAASNIRDLSTSVETHVNDKNFERIYVRGGLNAKPLTVEKIDLDSNATINEDEIESENLENDVKSERTDETKRVRASKEESEVEKEAWRLLRNAIVTYCGSPVGTVAANDPNDNLPLNYDQVFIRDFVPSAFAFLLKGEGEIVRNFLLHTLQLQSWEKTVDCYSPGQGWVPASFKVRSAALDDNKFEKF